MRMTNSDLSALPVRKTFYYSTLGYAWEVCIFPCKTWVLLWSLKTIICLSILRGISTKTSWSKPHTTLENERTSKWNVFRHPMCFELVLHAVLASSHPFSLFVHCSSCPAGSSSPWCPVPRNGHSKESLLPSPSLLWQAGSLADDISCQEADAGHRNLCCL